MPVKPSNKSKKTLKDTVIEVSLQLAVDRGWTHVALQDIAQEAGVSLAEMFDHFEDKTDVLVALGRRIDRQVLEHAGEGQSDESPRDRLFDVLMARFDVLNENRAGLVAILSSFRLDPKQAVISMPHLCRSMSWMLESAGVEASGIKGAIKVAGLTALYLKILKTWCTDDSTDMAKTMAALDKELGRVERWANSLGF